jgi:hypothetical protein
MLEYVPEHWKVLRHVRPKYSCSACQKIVQANAPSRPIERGYAGPGLLAHVWCPSIATTFRCTDKARSMPQKAWSSIAPHLPSGSAR